MTVDAPRLLLGAWDALAIGQKLTHTEEISANVSTNRVYRLVREDGHEYVAKTSSYGSYVHFRQDHALINSWIEQLAYTRYRDFLARVLVKDGKVFTYREGAEWVAIYEKAPFYDFLPKRLSDSMVAALGREMAEFHKASAKAARRMPPTWKTLGSDIATLYDFAGSDAWRRARGLALFGELRELLGLKLGGERIDDFIEFALHDAIELVQREVDAVVGQSALRKIVGPDAFGAVARSDETLARRGGLGLLLAQLLVADARCEHAERLFAVFVLRA